jgi:hypothetical protein
MEFVKNSSTENGIVSGCTVTNEPDDEVIRAAVILIHMPGADPANYQPATTCCSSTSDEKPRRAASVINGKSLQPSDDPSPNSLDSIFCEEEGGTGRDFGHKLQREWEMFPAQGDVLGSTREDKAAQEAPKTTSLPLEPSAKKVCRALRNLDSDLGPRWDIISSANGHRRCRRTQNGARNEYLSSRLTNRCNQLPLVSFYFM